jgi:hypothetical protein
VYEVLFKETGRKKEGERGKVYMEPLGGIMIFLKSVENLLGIHY